MPEVLPFELLRTFKFLISFVDDPEPVAGVSKCTLPAIKQEVISWRSAGQPRNSAFKLTGGTSYEPMTLEQGMAIKDERFEDWANAVSNWKEGQGGHDPANFRKDLIFDVMRLNGEIAQTYRIQGAWVSEFKLPEFDANTMNTIAITTLTVECEGFYRDRP